MSNNLGMGVMISRMTEQSDSRRAYEAALNKKIKTITLDTAERNSSLLLRFEDGSTLRFRDEGQSCCENRYMATDDNLLDYIGGQLLGAELRTAPNAGGDEDHEVQFLAIETSKGQFVISSHNEHNGYYGGFAIACFAD